MSPLLIYQPLGSDPNILARFSSATIMLHNFISGCGIQFFLINKLSSYFGKDTLGFTVLSSYKNLVYAGGLWSKSVLVSPRLLASGKRQPREENRIGGAFELCHSCKEGKDILISCDLHLNPERRGTLRLPSEAHCSRL